MASAEEARRASEGRGATVEELERQKLAEQVRQLRLERRKLEEEVRQLGGRWKPVWRALLGVRDLVAIATVVATFVYGVFAFLAQQRERHRFDVTREVITLVEKLSAEKEADRHGAAILLAAHGTHVLPILMNSLFLQARPSSPALATALKLVAGRKPAAVLEPLRERTSSLAAAVQAGEETQLAPLMNHVVLLGDLGDLGGRDGRAESVALLGALRDSLGCPEPDIAGAAIPQDRLRLLCVKARNAAAKLDRGA